MEHNTSEAHQKFKTVIKNNVHYLLVKNKIPNPVIKKIYIAKPPRKEKINLGPKFSYLLTYITSLYINIIKICAKFSFLLPETFIFDTSNIKLPICVIFLHTTNLHFFCNFCLCDPCLIKIYWEFSFRRIWFH